MESAFDHFTEIQSSVARLRDNAVLTSLHEYKDHRRLRTTVKLNSYDFQSSAKIEIWTDQHGWVPLWDLPYTQMAAVAVGLYCPDKDKIEMALIEDEERLLATAREILS